MRVIHHKCFFTNFSTTCLCFVEMNKFSCCLVYTWLTIIDYKYYVIDSLSCDVSVP